MTTTIQPASTAPAGHAVSSLLEPRYLAAVSRMELVAKQVMDGYIQGMHKSPHIGFALDFAQHRQYVPGDDIKRIDWRVYAKADRYYIKQYEVTTNLRCFVALDASGSMKYQGSLAEMSKFRYGQYIASCLAYLVLHQQDSCGLITFDTKIRDFLPPRSASSHLLTITRTLDATQPGNESAIAPQLHDIAERVGNRSMIVVISDFFDNSDDLIQALHHLRHKRHEVLMLQIMAEEELTFPFRKFSEFENLEKAGHRVKLDPAIVRARYLESVQAHIKKIRDSCNALRISHTLMKTSQPLDDALTRYLASRMGSRRMMNTFAFPLWSFRLSSFVFRLSSFPREPLMLLMATMLIGTAAAAIPVAVHLLHRQRSTPVLWGAMQFLTDTTIQQRRRKNIDHWLLLLLRMLAIAFMALLLSRPLIISNAYNPLATSASSDIAIVVDHSLSMGRRSGDRTLFDSGIDIVDQVSKTLHTNDTLSIILAEHTPRPFTEHPISNASSNAKEQLDALRQALRQVQPGMTDCSIPDALKTARDQVNTGRNLHKIILVLTDEQRSNWHPENDAAWRPALGDREHGPDKDIAVFAISVPPGGIVSNAANLSISNLSLSPALIGINRVYAVTATVSNTGPGDLPGGAPISLSVDGKRITTQPLRPLPAGESATVRFEHVLTDPGSHWLKLSAEIVDGLDADNSAYAALDAIDRLPVLVIDGDLAGIEGFHASRFLSAALTPVEPGVGGALVEAKTVSPTDASRELLDKYAVIILNDVPRLSPDVISRLTDTVQAGHGLWIILGPRTDPDFLANSLCKTPLLPLTIKARKSLSGTDVATLAPKEPDHPILSLITTTDRNAFAGTTVTNWWQVEPALAAESAASGLHTLIDVNHNDVNQPLVLTHDVGKSGGRVVVWTSGVDRSWNELPVAKNFVPLVQETVLFLATGLDAGKNRRLQAGQPLVFTAPGAPAITELTVTNPDGTIKKPQPILTNGKYVLNYSDTRLPGLYALRFKPDLIPQPVYFTANIDRDELDPAPLADSDMQWLTSRKYLTNHIKIEGLDRALGTENRGTELWPFLALAILVMLVVETFVSWRVARLQEGAAVT